MPQHDINLEIIPVSESDISVLVELFLLVERQHEQYWPLRWALRPDIQERYTRWITANRTNPQWLFIVAREKPVDSGQIHTGDVIGGLAAAINEEIPIYQYTHYAFIHDLAVREDARRRGVGRALVDYARQWAGAKGVNQLRLMVAEPNTAARELFQTSGFQATYREMVLPVTAVEGLVHD